MSPLFRRIWLLNLAGNAALLALIYGWLSIPDRRTWQLGATALLGLVTVAAALLLHTATFAAFRGQGLRIPRLRQVMAFAGCVAGVVLVLWALEGTAGYFPKWTAWLSSALTLKLHRPVKPASVLSVLNAVRWLLAWLIVPVLALPGAGAAAAGECAWRIRKRFWLEYAAAWLLGWYVPSKLVHWVPEIENLAVQTLSFLLRFGLAWGLAITAWVALARASVMPAEDPK